MPSRSYGLPRPKSGIVGRSRELDEVLALLRRPDLHLVTLTGPGGVGKTRLALEVAARVAPTFEDGAAFVDLAVLRGGSTVLPSIAQAAGVRGSRAGVTIEVLTASLAKRHLLLVLDNFEHVLVAGPELAALLARCADVKVLATSRERLRLQGEQVYPLAPLAVPDSGGIGASGALLHEYPAVELFVSRAREVRPSFATDDSLFRDIAVICAALDGLPLAIELAAARMTHLTPATLRARLTRRLPLLTGGFRDRPARQQTMRTAIAWSYDLLSPDEQALVRRLSVFVGGCTLEAAECVGGEGAAQHGGWAREPGEENEFLAPPRFACPLAPSVAPSVLETIGSLVEKNLVQWSTGVGGEPRYTMLETIREFAREQLQQRGEEAAVQRRRTLYYMTLATNVEASRIGLAPPEPVDRLASEHVNLAATLHAMALGGQIHEVLSFAASLWPLWLEHGRLTEGRTLLAPVLGLPFPEAASAVWAKAAWVAGALAQAQGDNDQATDLCERALQIFRSLDDARGSAAAATTLGLVSLVEGDYARAERRLQEGLKHFGRVDDLRAGSWALRHLATLAFRRGDLRAGRNLARQGLALVRRRGAPLDVARLLHTLGVVTEAAGDARQAVTDWEEALALYRAADDRWGVANTLGTLGEAARGDGDQARARELLGESLALYREVGDPEGAAYSLASLGWLAHDEGRAADAARSFQEAMSLAETFGGRLRAAESLIGLGVLAIEGRDTARAARCLSEALRLAIALDDRLTVATVLRRIGSLAQACGEPRYAADLLRSAEAIESAADVSVLVTIHPVSAPTRRSVRPDADDERSAPPLLSGGSVVAAEALSIAGSVLELAAHGVDEAHQPATGRVRAESGYSSTLSRRELDVLGLVVAGKSDREIAERLYISHRTASTHVSNILTKLDVASRVEAAVLALRDGLV